MFQAESTHYIKLLNLFLTAYWIMVAVYRLPSSSMFHDLASHTETLFMQIRLFLKIIISSFLSFWKDKKWLVRSSRHLYVSVRVSPLKFLIT
jgi:hypothetical protein